MRLPEGAEDGGRLPWNPAGLAGGHPGLAVLAAALDEAFPGEGWDRVAHQQMAAATADGSILGHLDASLYAGWGGLTFVANLLSSGGRRYRSFLATADGQLCARAMHLVAEVERSRPPIPPYATDVITGLSGIAAVLLARRGEPGLRQVLEAVLASLVSLAAKVNGVPRLASPPDWGTRLLRGVEGPILNLGLAHGLPGPLAALSIARIEGECAGGDEEAIEALADLLLCLRCEDEWGITWPCAVAVQPEERSLPVLTRAAWCYGAPGCARALWLAGAAMGREEWKKAALEVFHTVLRRPAERRGLPSTTFCHGRAGLLYIALRFATDTGDPVIASWLPSALDRLAGEHDPVSRFGYCGLNSRGRGVADPGLLDGAAGVGLVLLAASSPIALAWDRAFLLG